MNYVNIHSGEVAGFRALRDRFPQVSLPQGGDLPELGWMLVRPAERPVAAAGEVVVPAAPVEVDGLWYEGWQCVARMPEVPESIEALQGLLALYAAGLAPAFEAWAQSPARSFAERAFIDRARTWRRDNLVLVEGAAAMGISPGQLDQLFIAAGVIEL
jgi:hypothetical protein